MPSAGFVSSSEATGMSGSVLEAKDDGDSGVLMFVLALLDFGKLKIVVSIGLATA